jgi:hypothetical protein
MKTRNSLVSNSSSTSFVVCNIDQINVEDIQIDKKFYPKASKQSISKILNILKKDHIFGTESGYSNDSDAFNCIVDYVIKHKDKFVIHEMECGADNLSYIVSVTKELIEEKSKL